MLGIFHPLKVNVILKRMLLYWLTATTTKKSLSISAVSLSVYKYKVGIYKGNSRIKVILMASRKSAEMK